MSEMANAPTPNLQARVTQAIRTHGISEVARRLNLGPESVARIAAGAGVRRGTHALAEMNVHKLQEAVA